MRLWETEGGWIRKLRACARHFGWEDLSGESVEGITQSELKDMLRGIAWGRVTEEWGRICRKGRN